MVSCFVCKFNNVNDCFVYGVLFLVKYICSSADYMLSALKNDGLDNVHTEDADVRSSFGFACIYVPVSIGVPA